jgi:O-antigen/teichoic acid export membrane protein
VTSATLPRFLQGALSAGMGNFSVMAFGLIGAMIVARVLPAEAFGAFILLQVIATFLTRLSSFGLNISATRFISAATTGEQRQQIVTTVLLFKLVTIPVVALLALLGRPLLSFLFDLALVDQFYLFILVLFALESLGQLLRAILQGTFQFGAIAKMDLISGLLGLLLMVLFVLLLGYGLAGLIYSKVLSMLVAQFYAFACIPISRQSRLDFAPLRQMLRFGLPLQLNDILTFFYLRADTLMIGALLGPAQIAYYEIARKIPESISGLYEAFRSVYFPFVSKYFAGKEFGKAATLLNQSTRLLTFFTILGTLIALLFGHQIITLMFSDRYLASAPVFALLMLRISLAFIDYTLGYSLVAAGAADKPVYINSVQTVVSLAANLMLIPLYGIVGAALAGVIGLALVNPLNVLFLRRRAVAVQVSAYLLPILIFAGCWLVVQWLAPTTWLAQAAIILLFLAGCLATSVIRLADLASAFEEIKLQMLRYRRHPGSQGGSA